MTDWVHILHISVPDASDSGLTVHATEESAMKCLMEFVRGTWAAEFHDPLPDNDDEALFQFFDDDHRPDCHWSIEKLPILA